MGRSQHLIGLIFQVIQFNSGENLQLGIPRHSISNPAQAPSPGKVGSNPWPGSDVSSCLGECIAVE